MAEMIDRRDVLRGAAATGAGLFLGSQILGSVAAHADPTNAPEYDVVVHMSTQMPQ